MSNASMTNHTVVIKGATGGIGFQSALGIAKTRSDARIIIIGRNKERGEAAHTGRINTRFARPNMALNVFANSSNLLGRRGVQSKHQGVLGRTDAQVHDGFELPNKFITIYKNTAFMVDKRLLYF